MALTTININFEMPLGSYGILVEYKLNSDTNWITPTTPDNPTMLGTYPLTIEVGLKYNVRVSNIGKNCVSGYIFRDIIVPTENCCPETYTLSPDGEFCYKVNEVEAEPPVSGANAVAVTNAAYSTCGSYIY